LLDLMPVSYSADLRRRVIIAWEAKEGSQHHPISGRGEKWALLSYGMI
jgi:hypothetical protein